MSADTVFYGLVGSALALLAAIVALLELDRWLRVRVARLRRRARRGFIL